jgi:hypothetical protein
MWMARAMLRAICFSGSVTARYSVGKELAAVPARCLFRLNRHETKRERRLPRHPSDKVTTGAERQRQWRERLRQERGPATAEGDGSSQELIKARHEIERLRAQLAAATRAAPPATAALLRIKIENDELRKLLAASRMAEPEQIADLRRDIERLQADYARRDAASRVTEAARDRGANDPRVARLQRANQELRKEIAAMREQFEKQSQKQGVMSFKTASMISKALHPDSKPTDHDRAEAFKAFSGWKADRNAAKR